MRSLCLKRVLLAALAALAPCGAATAQSPQSVLDQPATSADRATDDEPLYTPYFSDEADSGADEEHDGWLQNIGCTARDWFAQQQTCDCSNDAARDTLCAACEQYPRIGLIVFVGYDAWRGITDGSWENNGIHTGLNFGSRLGPISDLTGVGFQLGGSVGVYDWSGTDYRVAYQTEAEPQGFITYGFFRHATESCPWSAALVHDWMLNAHYGVFAENPTLGQWRGQIGYATSWRNEIGVWGTWRLHDDSRLVNGFGQVDYRAVNQLNFFWHYKWGVRAPDTWLWVGVPEHDRLTGNGSLGDYIAGAFANCPLNDWVSLYAMVSYMHPSATPGPAAALEEAWNFNIGLAFYARRNARSQTVAGQCWMPQLPVANNGFFMVDSNQTY